MAAVKYLDETGLNTLWTKQQKLRWADVNRWAASIESANNSLVTLDTLADGTGWTVVIPSDTWKVRTFNGKVYTMAMTGNFSWGQTDSQSFGNMILAVVITNGTSADAHMTVVTEAEVKASPLDYLVIAESTATGNGMIKAGALYDYMNDRDIKDDITELQDNISAALEANTSIYATLNQTPSNGEYSSTPTTPIVFSPYLTKKVYNNSTVIKGLDWSATGSNKWTYTPYSGTATSNSIVWDTNTSYSDSSLGYGKHVYAAGVNYNNKLYTASRTVYVTLPVYYWFNSVSTDKALNSSNTTINGMHQVGHTIDLSGEAMTNMSYFYIVLPQPWTLSSISYWDSFNGSGIQTSVPVTNLDSDNNAMTTVINGVTYNLYRTTTAPFQAKVNMHIVLSGTGSIA